MDGYRGKSVVYRVKRKHKNVLNRTHRAFERMGESIQASHFVGFHLSHSRSGRLSAKD